MSATFDGVDTKTGSSASVCVACVVRFPILRHLRVTDTSCGYFRGKKYRPGEANNILPGTIVPLGMWVVVECNMGIGRIRSIRVSDIPNLINV
jgi:hypothetical protein